MPLPEVAAAPAVLEVPGPAGSLRVSLASFEGGLRYAGSAGVSFEPFVAVVTGDQLPVGLVPPSGTGTIPTVRIISGASEYGVPLLTLVLGSVRAEGSPARLTLRYQRLTLTVPEGQGKTASACWDVSTSKEC